MNWINCAVKLYSWPLTFCKVLLQQTCGRRYVLYSNFLHRFFLNLTVKKLWNLVHICRSYGKNNCRLLFLRHVVVVGLFNCCSKVRYCKMQTLLFLDHPRWQCLEGHQLPEVYRIYTWSAYVATFCWLCIIWFRGVHCMASAIHVAHGNQDCSPPHHPCFWINWPTLNMSCHISKASNLLLMQTDRRLEAFEMWIWRRMEKISWLDKVTNEEALRRVNEDGQILNSIWQRKHRWIGQVLRHLWPTFAWKYWRQNER